MDQAVFLKPPPHGLIANWLGPEMVRRLLDFAQEQRDSFFPTGVGYGENARIDANIRHSGRITKLGDLKQELRTRIRAVLPTVFRQLGADAFEPGRIEVEMVAHGDGALYTEHRDDAVEDKKFVVRRVITVVYYFHRLPKAFSGGVLRIYPLAGSKNSTAFVDIEPTNDTLVFFPSWFPHEVLPVACPSSRFEDSRFAINFWVHR
jgi:Rps23 Pro-64 3,4-dihydroxylase Tpa1-like proline 4-hydroxylase